MKEVEHNYMLSQLMAEIADCDACAYEFGKVAIERDEMIFQMPCTDDLVQDAEYCRRLLLNNIEVSSMMVMLGRLEGEDDYNIKGDDNG
tara:strand:+ start:823 stop:1089 length:267 start_codon:yes stop_codon:yes gene_type:complete